MQPAVVPIGDGKHDRDKNENEVPMNWSGGWEMD
jgi:hypothetical protein